MQQSRINALIDRLSKLNVDVMIVLNLENRLYLSGFLGSNATLFIHPDKRILITDSRYTEQAKKQAKYYEIITTARPEEVFYIISNVSNSLNAKCIGFEADKVTYDWYTKLSSNIAAELVPLTGIIEDLRSIKDDYEIELIKKAQSITDQAFLKILDYIKPGISEVDIASELCYYMAKSGCQVAFETIVASGPNGSMPHARPTNRKIQNGDFVTVDFGCKYNGYCSDMTRTVAVGSISEEMRKVYDSVLNAQQLALGAVHEGVKGNDIDRIARNYISNAGYGGYFGHGLGHSLGLEVHEEPRFSKYCEEVIKSGMCLSVEPGIYLPGKFGVRIEDIIKVTENGCYNFTNSPKELIIL